MNYLLKAYTFCAALLSVAPLHAPQAASDPIDHNEPVRFGHAASPGNPNFEGQSPQTVSTENTEHFLFTALPELVQYTILDLLPPTAIGRLAQTCKALEETCFQHHLHIFKARQRTSGVIAVDLFKDCARLPQLLAHIPEPTPHWHLVSTDQTLLAAASQHVKKTQDALYDAGCASTLKGISASEDEPVFVCAVYRPDTSEPNYQKAEAAHNAAQNAKSRLQAQVNRAKTWLLEHTLPQITLKLQSLRVSTPHDPAVLKTIIQHTQPQYFTEQSGQRVGTDVVSHLPQHLVHLELICQILPHHADEFVSSLVQKFPSLTTLSVVKCPDDQLKKLLSTLPLRTLACRLNCVAHASTALKNTLHTSQIERGRFGIETADDITRIAQSLPPTCHTVHLDVPVYIALRMLRAKQSLALESYLSAAAETLASHAFLQHIRLGLPKVSLDPKHVNKYTPSYSASIAQVPTASVKRSTDYLTPFNNHNYTYHCFELTRFQGV